MTYRIVPAVALAASLGLGASAAAAPHATPSPCFNEKIATANCENGYDAQKHTGKITPECRRNGAMGAASPSPSPAPHSTPRPSPSPPPCKR